MRVKLADGEVELIPENSTDHAAIHNIKGLGIASLQLLDTGVLYGPGLPGPLLIKLRPELSLAQIKAGDSGK